MTLLAGDVGGTKTQLALLEHGSGTIESRGLVVSSAAPQRRGL